MVGFSYRQIMYKRCHENYPDKPIMGTENLGQWHEWKACIEKEYISGIFLWTGIDYIGESGNSDVWPIKATRSGLLDVAGFKKPSYYMFKSLWTEEKCAHIATQTLDKSLYDLVDDKLVDKSGKEWQRRLWLWQDVNNHYNYTDGENVVIEVYSNCEELDLVLNGNLISSKKLSDLEDRIYKWCIPYKAGTLEVKYNNTVLDSITTSGEIYSSIISADKSCLDLNYDSVCHIECQLLDNNGLNITHTEAEVEFVVSDNAKVLGLDNGSALFVGDHFSSKVLTNKGKALCVISKKDDEPIEVYTVVNGKKSNIIKIN